MSHLETNLYSATPLLDESPKNDVEVPQEGNPYDPPASELLEEGVFETDELKAYIGENTSYDYFYQWRDRSYRFNWSAFFLSGFWMAYRKMYWQFLVLLGATFILSLIEQTLLPISQAWISTLAVGLVCGFFGNKWYHNHALRVVRKARLKEPQVDERIKLLAKRGGTSQIPAIVVIVIAVIYIAFLFYTLITS